MNSKFFDTPGMFTTQEKRIAEFLMKLIANSFVMRHTEDGPISILGQNGGVSFLIIPSDEPTRNPHIRVRVFNVIGSITYRDTIPLNKVYQTVKQELRNPVPLYLKKYFTNGADLLTSRGFTPMNDRVTPMFMGRPLIPLSPLRMRMPELSIRLLPDPKPLSPEQIAELRRIIKETQDQLNDKAIQS